jgi:hypothetical protein
VSCSSQNSGRSSANASSTFAGLRRIRSRAVAMRCVNADRIVCSSRDADLRNVEPSPASFLKFGAAFVFSGTEWLKLCGSANQCSHGADSSFMIGVIGIG